MADSQLSFLDKLNSYNSLTCPPSLNPFPQSDDSNLSVTFDSIFYDIDSFIKRFKNTEQTLIASLNTQSLQSKFPQILSLINDLTPHNCAPSILALQETWNIPYPDLLNIPGYKLVISDRKTKNGGGVGFYIKDHFQFNILKNLSTFEINIFESLTIEVLMGKNKKIILSSIYRSPTPPNHLTNSQQMDQFVSYLDQLLTNLSCVSNPVYLLLDSNINALTYDPIIPNPYFSSLNENCFIQCIRKATRIQNNSASLIDHILTKFTVSSPKIISGVLTLDISDHFMTFIQTPTPSKAKKQPFDKRIFSRTSILSFKEQLSSLTWNNVIAEPDVNKSYQLFWEDFSNLYNLNFPLKKVKPNKNFHKINPFMTLGLLTSRREKIRLHKKSLAFPTQDNILTYRRYRNVFARILKASKKLYYATEFSKARKNPKKTWELINQAINNTGSEQKIDKITSNGQEITNKTEIANAFNDFFVDIGKNISESVPPTQKIPENFLQDINPPDMHLNPISPGTVVSLLKSLKSKSSVDIEGLTVKLLKEVAIEISKPLSHIFSRSFSLGIFPDKLKISRIVPVFKGGSADLCDNYRPIALLSQISKILEKSVANTLSHHLYYNKLIHQNQYGFQHKVSTEHNLTCVINYISSALNDGEFCLGIFLDLKKAFDVCSHEILFKKLENLGIRGTALNWFKSYLSNRSQQVDIEGYTSHSRSIEVSILQGSILGPILFLCYINDLPYCTLLKTFLFADDTQCLLRGKNLNQLIDTANFELNKISEWFRANKLAVNTKKTKYIIFHTKGKRVDMDGKNLIFNDNDLNLPQLPDKVTVLERIYNNHPSRDLRTYKLLGILLDENISLSFHINSLIGKLSRSIYVLNKTKNFLPKNILRTLYFSTFHSHLTYCPTIIGCSSNSLQDKIFKLQKKAVRIITNSQYRAHTDPIFKSLKILPFPKLVEFSKLTLMHSIHYKLSPPSLHNLFETNLSRNIPYQLRNEQEYFIPRVNFSTLKNFHFNSFPSLWNSYGPNKFQRNPTTFKIALKSELLGLNVDDRNYEEIYNLIVENN